MSKGNNVVSVTLGWSWGKKTTLSVCNLVIYRNGVLDPFDLLIFLISVCFYIYNDYLEIFCNVYCFVMVVDIIISLACVMMWYEISFRTL